MNPTAKTALVVGHPGHELLIYHWLETHQPLYCCLTDGSGRVDPPRLGSTSRVLQQVGSSEGPIFGRYSDQQIYRMLLEGNHEVFVGLLRELAEALFTNEIAVVVGDAPQGVAPTHDLCRYLIDAAVSAVERSTGRRLANYEFDLDSPPDYCPPELRSQAIWLRLDEVALERKLQAALGYVELRGETEEGLRFFGKNAFAVECLRPSTGSASLQEFEYDSPAYEDYGREGIDRFGKSFGRYEEVITFRQHVKPVVEAIQAAARQLVLSP